MKYNIKSLHALLKSAVGSEKNHFLTTVVSHFNRRRVWKLKNTKTSWTVGTVVVKK